jgi:hypothetical protein
MGRKKMKSKVEKIIPQEFAWVGNNIIHGGEEMYLTNRLFSRSCIALAVFVSLAMIALGISCSGQNASSPAEKEMQLRIERLEATIQIQNIMSKYQSYHSASDQEKTVELFAKKTPGGKCIFRGAIYEGYEGVKNHFLVWMKEAEKDLRGKLYLHEVVSPIIEVAKDAQTAKAQFSSIGCETAFGPNNTLMSLWSWDKYHVDFIKEDGEWKIYNLDFHTTFLTHYDGKGWTEEPDYDMTKYLPPNAFDFSKRKEDGFAATPYKALSLTSRDCDIHNLIPEPPLPYDTWDVLKDPWVVEKTSTPNISK